MRVAFLFISVVALMLVGASTTQASVERAAKGQGLKPKNRDQINQFFADQRAADAVDQLENEPSPTEVFGSAGG